jgi:transposase
METTQNTKKRDFSGQEIYVGIDVHKKQWAVTVRSEFLEHKTFVQKSDSKALGDYLKKNFPGAKFRSVYEAGFCGYAVHRSLIQEGIENIIINPADVPSTNKERKSKQDKIDSRKLCRALADGALTGNYVPAENEAELKETVRQIKILTYDLTRFKNRIKSKLERNGIRVPEEYEASSKSWSKRFVGWLETVELKTELGTLGLRLHIEGFRHLRELKKRLKKSVEEYVERVYGKEISLLGSIPGIGTTAGIMILSEVGDTSRFSSFEKLCSFVGLIPNTYSSGDKERTGRMTKRKNKYLQPVLVQCAWKAAGCDPALMSVYGELKKRMTSARAIVKITRKLLSRIRHVMLTKEPYVLGMEI